MDLIIRRTAQIDLSDNQPQHNNDEIVLEWIDSNCPDWNKSDTRKTYVIPPTFPDINKKMDERGQLTEKHVFDILEEFGDKSGQPMIVIHSYEFSERLQNFENGILKLDLCQGETDFVIVHRTLGVIFFQVKAAIKTAHKYGEAKKQLDKDWMAMTRSLKRLCLEDRLGTTVEAELKKCQGFVVMPNCPKDKALGKDGCFREDIQSVADFEKWWQENVHRTGVGEFSEDMYKLMAIRFVGLRVATESCLLKDVIDQTQRRIMLWTEDQLKIMTEDVPKQYIAGPAGSGKTLLLLKKAKQVAGKLKANERILIMCFNKPLKCFFEAEFRNFPTAGQIEVRTFVKILQEITGTRYLPEYDDEKFELVLDCIQNLYRMQSNPDLRMRNRYKYEHVFVDEGQDMYGMWMSLVNHMHDDDDVSNEEKRYKWVFFDNNQNVHFGSQNCIPQDTVNNTKLMKRVVRSTFNIFECSRKFLSPDVAAELDHGIVGKQVKWIDSLPSFIFGQVPVFPIDELVLRKGVELVMQEIAYLDSESVARSDIVVLTMDMREREEVRSILWHGYNIRTQSAEEAIPFPDLSAITVDSIRRFKGLERKVVILLDPPIDEGGPIMMDLNYVAMSRSYCYLVIVTSQYKKQKYIEKFAPKESPGRKRKQKHGNFAQKKSRKVL